MADEIAEKVETYIRNVERYFRAPKRSVPDVNEAIEAAREYVRGCYVLEGATYSCGSEDVEARIGLGRVLNGETKPVALIKYFPQSDHFEVKRDGEVSDCIVEFLKKGLKAQPTHFNTATSILFKFNHEGRDGKELIDYIVRD